MIRHSSSFIISLILHSLVFLLLFFSFKSIPKEVQKEKLLCVKLCDRVYEKEPASLPPTIPHANTEVIPQKVEKIPPPKAKEPPKKLQTTKTAPLAEERPKEIIQEQITTPKIEEKVQTPTPSLSEQKEEKSKQVQQEYLQEHLQKIVQMLQENLYYPRSARERNIVGEVVVKFMILQNGEVQKVEVLSNGSEILSNAAIKTIENLSGTFPKPKENLLLQLPINYSLK